MFTKTEQHIDQQTETNEILLERIEKLSSDARESTQTMPILPTFLTRISKLEHLRNIRHWISSMYKPQWCYQLPILELLLSKIFKQTLICRYMAK